MKTITISLILLSILALSSAADLSEVGLYFYYGPTANDSQYYSFENATSLPDHPNFVHPQTHIYIHGFHENQQKESVLTIVDAYLNGGRDINIVTLDYATLVAGDYISSVENMLSLAPSLAATLLDLFAEKLDRNNVTLVGHSLGGQLSGATGREIQKQSGYTITLKKIVALDPAFPLFPPYETVNKKDADFVFIIHTGAPTFGSPTPAGHVDFFPNGGHQVQPGCSIGLPFSQEDLCNHQRSWGFWAESIYLDGLKFYGYPSISYATYLLIGPKALQNKAVIMGIECPETTRGMYYLQTNADSKYARGLGN